MIDEQEYDEGRQAWCRDFTGHAGVHDFCVDHQALWCKACDGSTCPECLMDPHCPECHAALNEEYHDWDCSYAE